MGKAFDRLKAKRKVFVTEYIADMDATRAATEAGYAHPTQAGHTLLQRKEINDAIAEMMEPMLAESKLTAQNILAQLSNFLFSNLFKYIDEDGYIDRPLKELPEFMQQCITGYNVEPERYDRHGNMTSGRRVKVTLVDKVACLNLAMKYRNLLGADNQTNIGVFGTKEDVRNFWYSLVERSTKDNESDTIEHEIKKLVKEK